MKILKSSAQEYASHMRILRGTYPIDLAKSNSIPVEKIRKQILKQLRLPKGQKTPNQYFYTIFQEEDRIGYLWLEKRKIGHLFISHIYIFSRYRSKGFGSRVMKWIQSKARSMNCTEVRLRVFGHNDRAIDFYNRCGFLHTSISLKKRVPEKTRTAD